ncbi:MAG: hypothetical protein HQK55_17565 [Deltaproteobacteria bacterium]|nr:hypothetical protein [Deltaproteobacteria bacterium]
MPIDAFVSSCKYCERFHNDNTCEAFPAGIPEEILSGRNNHDQPYPGDNGLTYLAKPWPPVDPDEDLSI